MKKLFNRKMGIKSAYAALVVVSLVIVIVLNIVMGALADRYPLSIDLTPQKIFALSEETEAYIASLDTPVTIRVLATEERFQDTSIYNAQANAIMRLFAKQSDAIEIEYIDYVSNPGFAAGYPELSMKHGDVLVSGGGRDKLVRTEELFNYTYGSDGTIAIASSKAEEAIVSAILNVTSTTVPKVAVITGHGETGVAAFRALLESNNYETAEVNLLTGSLGEDTELVLLMAPTVDLSPEEITLLDAFLSNDGAYGKNLFYCASPEQPVLPNLEAFLAEWGVKAGDGLVFETDETRVYSTQPFYAIADFTEETYAGMMNNADVPMLVAVSRPLEVLFSQQERYVTRTLLEFGASSGVRPSDAADGFTADMATVRGPIPALVLCSYRITDPSNASRIQASSSILACGSVEVAGDFVISNSSFANAEYLIHVLNDLCEKDDGIAVTPKTIVGNALNLSQSRADSFGNLFVFYIPAAILLLGIGIWLYRRHK